MMTCTSVMYLELWSQSPTRSYLGSGDLVFEGMGRDPQHVSARDGRRDFKIYLRVARYSSCCGSEDAHWGNQGLFQGKAHLQDTAHTSLAWIY